MTDEFFTKREAHSEAKHHILTKYLVQWFPKLVKYEKRLIYIDGFAGPGRYVDGDDGSPIVALKALLEHKSFHSWGNREFDFVFVEANKKYFDTLNEEVERYLEEMGGPSNVRVFYLNDKFVDILKRPDLAKIIESRDPLFAFIDPFGFGDIPMRVIADITKFKKSEVMLNLSIDSISRFFTTDSVEALLNSLFDLTAQERYSKLQECSNDQKRPEKIRSIYIDQLKNKAKMDLAWSFEMTFTNGHTGYYLIFGTHHLEGLKAIKEAMWSVDPSGNFRFADRLAKQLVLFSKNEVNTEPLKKALVKKYSGREVTVDEIIQFTVEETPYLDTHVRNKTLSPMEKEKKISVIRTGRSGFKTGTKIKFL